jgi:hypothetical protein
MVKLPEIVFLRLVFEESFHVFSIGSRSVGDADVYVDLFGCFRSKATIVCAFRIVALHISSVDQFSGFLDELVFFWMMFG